MNTPPASRFDILCAGSIVQDTIIHPVDVPRWGTTTFVDRMERFVGGNGANTASALALLGNRVRLLGITGADESAQFVRARLREAGVEIETLETSTQPNASTVVLVNSAGERQFLHRLGSSADAFSEAIEFTDTVVGGAKHLHLASIFVLPQLRSRAAEILARARASGLSTSIDVNWDPRGEWLAVLKPVFPFVDIFFVNEDESKMLAGVPDLAQAASAFHSLGVHTVVQKLGGDGCTIFAADSSPVHCDPYEVCCVDTTGAGDCFAAGYLTAYLKGASLADCGDLGNAAGALSVSRVGATAGLLRGDQLQHWCSQTPRRHTNPVW